MAAVLNLEPQGVVINASFVQNETWSLPLIWKTGSAPSPVNLTGYTARMMVRRRAEVSTALISLTDASGIALGGAAGTITVTLTATQTTSLPAGKLVYDLELVSPAGVVTNIARGTLTVIQNVTR